MISNRPFFYVRSACSYMCGVNGKTIYQCKAEIFDVLKCIAELSTNTSLGPVAPPTSPKSHQPWWSTSAQTPESYTPCPGLLNCSLFSGGFSQSRISLRKSALFYKNHNPDLHLLCLSTLASCATHPTGSLYVSLKLLKQSTMHGRRPFKGSCQLRKAP